MTSKQFDKNQKKETLTSFSDLAPTPSSDSSSENSSTASQTEKETKKKPTIKRKVRTVTKAEGRALEDINWKRELKEQELTDRETTKLKAQMAENQKKAQEMPVMNALEPVKEIQNADELGILADKDLFMKERLIPKTTLKNTLTKALNIMTSYFGRQNDEVKEPKFADRIQEGVQFIDKNTFTQNEGGVEKTKNITWTIKHKLEKKGKVEWNLVGNNGESFIVTPTELESEIKNGSLKIKA